MASPAQDPRLGTTLGGGYRLEARLGAGGMGVVYRARRGDTLVAVKRLHDSFAGDADLVKRFSREVAAMGRLRHPNLVTILDSGVEGGVPFLVMEHLIGRSLGERLASGPIPASEALSLMQQVLAGLELAHARGVVHRDLKPDNVFLANEGDTVQAKVLDFGVAKLLDSGATQLTSTGLAVGTPAYMPPEQALGTPTDARADLYAAGVMLYEMLAGRRPFVADSPIAIVRMQLEERPPSLRELAPGPISEALEAVVLRAMEKEPAARWPDAGAFARALAATPEGGGRAPRRPWRPGRWTWRGAIVVLLAAGGTYAWSRLSHREQRQMRRSLDETVGKAKTTLGQVDQMVDKARNTVGDVARALETTTEPKPAPVENKPAPVENKTTPVENKTAPPPEDDDNDDDDGPEALPSPVETAPVEATPTPEATARAVAARPVRLADAVRLVNTGKIDEGIAVLRELRRRKQGTPEVALWLGHAYFRKNWRTDGLREYANALRTRPQLRSDVQLDRNLIIALDDPTFRTARAILVRQVGPAALPALRRAAQKAENAKVRERAARIIAVMTHKRSRR